MIMAGMHPQCVHRMVVWGANATVTAEDVKLYETIRDTSNWSPKMREPLEGKACMMLFLKFTRIINFLQQAHKLSMFLKTSVFNVEIHYKRDLDLHNNGRPHLSVSVTGIFYNIIS